MKTDEKNIEQALLLDLSLDELIKKKMEEELRAELNKINKKPERTIITSLSDVPKEHVFSKYSVYKIFNKVNKQESYLNGLQAEALIGTQNSVREKMLAGVLDAFSTENAYVKFEKAVLVGDEIAGK